MTQQTNLEIKPTPTPEAQLMQMTMGCFVSQAVCVAARLGIADLVAEKPQTIENLAAATNTHAQSLYRVLRTLASVGVFAETDPQIFGLTPLAEPLRSDAARSLRDAAVFIGASWHWNVYGEMMHSVRTGEPAWKRVHGSEVFPYFQQNPAEYEIFNRAMTGFSQQVAPAIVEAYDFSGAATLVDIAGGHGILLAAALKANPNLNGVLFDLPQVVAGARALLEREAVANRVAAVAGDFFEAVPADCDAYMMKHIIHDWDDDRAVKILKNINRAMTRDGRVLIVEQVIPGGNEPHPGKIMDLEMLVSPGGVERTAEEYRKLLAAAGLRLTRIVPTQSPFSIVEAVKE